MKVCLISYIPEGEKIAAIAAKSTQSLNPPSKLDASEKAIERILKHVIEKQHSSVLNFPYYIFSFEGVSRVFTHQWVRYRIAAHLQQSLRYVEKRCEFVIPPTILRKGKDAVVTYLKNQKQCFENYRRLLKLGIPKEDARFALPSGIKTHIISVMNAHELLHVFSQRLCYDAQWEIRIACHALAAAVYLTSPKIFYNYGPACISKNICLGRSEGACKDKVLSIIEKVKERVDSKRDIFENMERGKEIEIDLTDILGFRVDNKIKECVKKEFGDIEIDYEVKVCVRKI